MKLIAQTPIMHDGARVEEGQVFDVKNEKQANALIETGAAHNAKANKPKAEAEADAAQPEAEA